MLNTAAIPTSGVLDVALIGSTSATASYDAVAALDSFMLTARDWVGEAGRQLQYEFRALQVWHSLPLCMSHLEPLSRSIHGCTGCCNMAV